MPDLCTRSPDTEGTHYTLRDTIKKPCNLTFWNFSKEQMCTKILLLQYMINSHTKKGILISQNVVLS